MSFRKTLLLQMSALVASLTFGPVVRADEPAASSTCIERIPQGAERPKLVEKFPERGQSGFAATLEVEVEHGKGEAVLPNGLELRDGVDAAKELTARGFAIPHQDGGAAARLTVEKVPASSKTRTRFELFLVPLNKEPGRHVLLLPPLPITVSRASGELLTVCTRPHKIVVEDPTSSTPNAKPKDNPAPRPQREEWESLRKALSWILVGAGVGAVLAFLVAKWVRRPRPVPPPPPPRPPWEVALERLDEVRHAGLLEAGRFGEFFDRTNDIVRTYLGGRFGFDGLESTSAEILNAMQKVQHFGIGIDEIRLFLDDTDLVKFANVLPTTTDCERVLLQAERVVHATMPGVRGEERP